MHPDNSRLARYGLLGLIGALSALAFALLATRSDGSDRPAASAAQASEARVRAAWREVPVAAPEERDLLQRWPARLVPARRWVLKAASDAQIVENHLEPGRVFAPGELLLRLNDAALASEHRATLRKIARLRLQLTGEVPEVLRAQYSELRLRTEVTRLQADADTQRQLLDKGLVPRVELQMLEQRVQDTALQHATATRELATARAQAQLSQDDARSELLGLLEQERVQAERLVALELRAPFAGRLGWVSPDLLPDVKRGAELALLESVEGMAAEMRLVRSAEVDRLFAAGAPVTVRLRTDARAQESAVSWAIAQVAPEGRAGSVRSIAGSGSAGDQATAPSSSALVVVQIALQPDAAATSAPWTDDAQVDAWVRRRVPAFRVDASAVRSWQERSYVYVRSIEERGLWLRREVDGCPDGQGGFLVVQGLRRGDVVAVP